MKTKITRQPKSHRCLTQSIATLLATTFLTATWVQAAPQGATVVSGHATISQKGDKLTIRPSDNAIINYSSFSIGAKEKVQFLQLSSNSRVLNRVTDPNPSHIFGTLQANGHVFLINPYGVYLENGSVLNVGSFTAAAGHLSDADFLAGRNHFTDIAGSVVNRGIINAQDDISLIGGNVANFGTLVSQQGTVAMVSGTDILIGKKNGNVFVNAAPAARKASAGNVTAGVQNAGRVRAPRALLAAGDLYAVAISNTGIIQSRQTTLQGGAHSTVHVSGTINASNKAGKGGQVKITGGKIQLQKATVDASGSTGGGEIIVGGDPVGQNLASFSSSIAMDAGSTLRASSTAGPGGRVVVAGSQAADSTVALSGLVDASSQGGLGGQVAVTGVHLTLQGAVIDASGTAGGGEILVGGDLHGQGTTPTATTTSINASSKLKADATVRGNGGKVVVWANQQTDYAGSISAQGAGVGDGGQAEVSGKGQLNYLGTTVLTAPGGRTGTLLLDPANITIATGGTDTITGGLVAFGDTPTTSMISPATLIAALGTADVTLQATNDITFSSGFTTASTHGLTLQAGHSIFFGSVTLSLGGALTVTANDPGGTPAANPALSSSGSIQAASISLTNSGGAINVGALTATSAITLTGTSVALNGTVNAGTLSVTGPTTLAANVTTNTSTSNAQFYHSNVTLGANVTLTTTTAQTINFGGTIDSDSTARSLSIQMADASTNTFFNGNIGSTAPLASLTLTGVPVFQSTATSITTTGAQQLGSQAVFFGGTTTFTSTNSGAITFGKIDAGDTLTAHNLTVDTAGNVIFNGAVSSILSGGIPTLPVGSLTVSNAAGTVTFNGGAVYTTGTQTYAGADTLGADTTFTGSSVTFNSTVAAGAHNLTLTTGALEFDGAVSGTGHLALQGLSAASPVASISFATYTEIQTGFTDLTFGRSDGTLALDFHGFSLNNPTIFLSGTGNISLATLTGNFAITANTAGNTILNGGISVASLTTDAAGNTQINGGVTTTGAQTYNDSVSVGGAATLQTTNCAVRFASTTALAADLTVNAGSGNITFTGAVNGAHTLTANSTGTTLFSSTVGATTALSSLTTDAGGVTSLSGNVTTTGAQNYGDNVTIGTALTLATTNSAATLGGTTTLNGNLTVNAGTGNITFTGAVNGAHALNANSTGTTLFSSTVGATTALTSLTTNAGGSTTLTGNVSTSGDQAYSDAVTLAADSTLTSTAGGVSLATVDGNKALTITANTGVTLAGQIGSTTALSLLNITSTAPITLDSDLVETTGSQTYSGPLTLGFTGTTALTSTSNGTLTFAAIDASAAGRGLTASSGATGSIVFNGIVGGTTPLDTLIVSGSASITLNGGAITTTNGQSYTGDITLEAPATLTSNAAGLSFGKIDGAEALTLQASTTVTFGGEVGGTNRVGFLSVTSPEIDINTDLIQTSGGQFDNGSIVLGTTTTLDNDGGAMFFRAINATTDGGQGLSVTGTTTSVSFAGSLGATHRLASFTLGAGISTILFGNISTTGNQTFNSDVTIENGLTLNSNAGAIALQKVDGAGALVVSGATGVTFNAELGSTTALTSLNVSAPGHTIALNTDLVKTTGAQTYHDAMVLDESTTLNGGAMTLAAVDATTAGGQALTVTASGTTTFNGIVGGTATLSALNVNGTGAITIDTTAINTAGAQSYTGITTLGASSTLTSTGSGAIHFFSTVNGAPAGTQGLTLATAGTITFAQAVGQIKALQNLEITNAASTLQVNGGFIAVINDATFGGTVQAGANALTIQAGSLQFEGQVTGTSTLTLLGSTNVTGIELAGGSGFTPGPLADATPLQISAATLGEIQPGFTHLFVGSTTGSLPIDAGSFSLPADTTLRSGTGAIAVNGLQSDATSRTLDIETAGLTTFVGNVGDIRALATLEVSGAAAINAAAIQTVGTQTYDGAVTLGGSAVTTLTSTGNQTIAFSSTIDGPQGLVIDTAAAVTFPDDIGGTTPLASLSVPNAAVTIDGALVSTTGAQTYGSTVTIPANGSVLFKAGADIDITGALLAPNAAVAFQTPGTVLLSSPFGTSAQPLASLTTSPLSTLEIGGANFAQTLIVGGRLVLDSDTTLTSTSGQYAFGNTVTSALPASLDALTLEVTGTVSFYGDLAYTAGGTNTAALSTLTIDGASTIQFTPGQTTAADAITGITATPGSALSIHTSFSQSYGATTDTLLGGSVTLLCDSATNTIAFTGPVDSTGGAHALIVNTPGNVIFAQSLGANSPLASLTVTGPVGSGNGAEQVGIGHGTGSVFTIDATGAVDLNAPLAVNASTTTITANSTTISGNIARTRKSAPDPTDSFTITGAGAITLQGDAFTPAVGGNGAIGVLDLESTRGVVTVQSVAALDSATLQGTTLVLGQLAPSTSSATITLDGGQHLFLNPTANTSGTADSTILHSPASSLVLTATQSVEMGAGQKLNAASGLSVLQGALVPIATTGVTITSAKVVLGDIATAGTLTINAPDIELLGRNPIADAPALQSNQTDLGLTLIGTTVDLGGVTPTFVTGTKPLAFIVANAAPGFVSTGQLVFVQDSNVVADLSAFDAAHPGLQPTDGIYPSAPIVTTGRGNPPAPKKRSAALPFNLLIDDPSILALLNDDERIWFGLIDTHFAFNDDDRRHIRHRHRPALTKVLMTQPDYQPVVSPNP